jgi:hypothetical protein
MKLKKNFGIYTIICSSFMIKKKQKKITHLDDVCFKRSNISKSDSFGD